MEYKGIDLSGRIALVTGGAGEIGRVICRTLAAYGADVIVNYMSSEKKAEDLCEEIRGMGRRAIAIKAEDGGPVLYKGERIGHDGKPFAMYKFRTMRPNADQMESFLTPE